ncbi:MAG TPA: TIGR03435 family protein [Terriglobales bacterium]|nr:TIGR03435 family protein [Terriglobales bacterium]
MIQRVLGVIVAIVAIGWAQSSAPAPGAGPDPNLRFEVASIKPSEPGGRRGSSFPLTPGDRYAPNDGLFRASGLPVLRYIAFAYGFDPNPDPQLAVLPGWTKSERYDIEARAGRPATKDEMRVMVRNLLVDRFKMKTHYETRNLNVYELMLIKPGQFGPQMRVHRDDGVPCQNLAVPAAPSAAPPPPSPAARGSAGRRGPSATPDGYPTTCGDLMGLPGAPLGRTRLGGRNVTMGAFLATLRGGMDRPVVDHTGLTGRYDWWIEYVQDPSTDGAVANPGRYYDPQGLKLWDALQQQLGLGLKRTKANVPWLVFDQIQRPTPN